MVNKGIILAGGTGKRLFPITKSINKHILPIGDKPMIYYPLSILMLAKIKNIEIITNPNEERAFKSVLGPTQDLGIKISYNFQKNQMELVKCLKFQKNLLIIQLFVSYLEIIFFMVKLYQII